MRKGMIPFPESIIFTAAGENDLSVFKQAWRENIHNCTLIGDKAYSDFEYFDEQKRQEQNIEMLTPVKVVKGESEVEKRRNEAFNDLFSKAVSKIRQPIESFFNQLNEKTKSQEAQKVRSTSGLLIHSMGKIVIAFIHLIFNY